MNDEQGPVEPTQEDGQELSPLQKIRERMAGGGTDVSDMPQDAPVDPRLCINCREAELENGKCPNCGYDKGQELYSGGL